MGIIKLEDDMTKAELLATQNSNNGYNEMIVDDMVDSIPETGANALVEIWSGSASAGATITLSESIYNFRMVFVQCEGVGQMAMVPIVDISAHFRGLGGHTGGTTGFNLLVSGTIISPTQITLSNIDLANLTTGGLTTQKAIWIRGMR